MILQGCMATSGCIPVKSRPFETTFPSFSVYSSLTSTHTTHSNVKNWCGASPLSRGLLLRGALLKPTFSNAQPSLSTGCHGSFIFPITSPSILRRSCQGTSTAPRASKDVSTTYRYESHGSFSSSMTSPSVLGRSRQETSTTPRASMDVPTTYRYPKSHGSFSFPITLPSVPRRSRREALTAPRASKDVPTSYRHPPMTKKPRWWWRTLACIPYLMPLHETWMYAETAYHLHPFLEDFEFLTYPFLRFIGTLPGWFLMAYFFVAYLGVVRRKEWPHFFRFHVVMGMLLEIALQVVGTVSRWLPLAIYWGKIGMHTWTFIAFAYLFTVLECIRCALAGMYADVPFACDAAYIQIPYD